MEDLAKGTDMHAELDDLSAVAWMASTLDRRAESAFVRLACER